MDNIGLNVTSIRLPAKFQFPELIEQLFVLDGATMVLLHGFIKKQQETPKPDLYLAKDRHKVLKRGK